MPFTTSIVLIDGRFAKLTYCPSAGGHNLYIDDKYQTVIPSCDLLLLGRLFINTACAIHECNHRAHVPGGADGLLVPGALDTMPKPKPSDALRPLDITCPPPIPHENNAAADGF